MQATKFKTIAQYHATFPKNVQTMLNTLRSAIKQAAPKAAELISYNMPAFKQNKVLVYYAAHAQHIGFYPTSKPMIEFKSELTKYKTSKGVVLSCAQVISTKANKQASGQLTINKAKFLK